jgi:drug/metabolite transporter (DMT)-like permease
VETELDRKSVLAGVGWMIVTGLLFVAVTGIVRHVGSTVPAAQAAFMRYLAGFVIMLPWLIRIFNKPRSAKSYGLFAVRGVAHSLGVILWFYAMARIPIAEVTAIGYVSPIFVTLGAALFLGEALALRRVMAVLAAFVGALIILRPGFREIDIGHIAQLGTAPLFAISYLLTKYMTRDEKPVVIVGMLTIFVTIGLAPWAYAQWVTPSLTDVAWLTLVAVFATTGHYTMTRALQAAPIMVTQPVHFLQLVWATLLGSIVFFEPIDIWVIIGGGVIVSAVSFISYREAVMNRASRTPPVPAPKG